MSKGQTLNTKQESKPIIIGASLDYGFIIIHSKSLRDINDSYPFGIRLDVSKHLLTKKAWDFCGCYPRAGFSLAYWNWDNPSILGHGVVTLGYLEPYFFSEKKTNLFVRMGLGAAFLSKPFDSEENPNNLSYSTHFNFPIVLGIGVNYRLSNQLNLRFAAKYNHISNGGFRTPNKGINFPTLSLGINRSLQKVDYPAYTKQVDRELPSEKYRISLVHQSGWSNAVEGNKKLFYVLGFEVKYSRLLGHRSALTGGTEWVADFSRKETLKLKTSNVNFQRAAILIGHEFWLGKVTFSQQLGVYYYDQLKTNDPVYQRFGLTIQTFEKVFFGFNLKTHRHIADFFDLRMGYTF